MAAATDVTAFIAAAASLRDAWVNYNPNDNSSRDALTGAAVGLGAATLALTDGRPMLNLIGVTGAGISLSADVRAYDLAVAAGDARAQKSATFAIVSDVAGGAAGMAAVLAETAGYKPLQASLGVAAVGLTLVSASATGAKAFYDATNRLDDILGNWGNDINKNMLEQMLQFGGGPVTQYASTALNGVITAANAAEAGNAVKLSASDSPEGAKLVVGLDPDSSGGARQIVFDPQAGTATILVGNGSGVTVAAGSQISVGSGSVRASTFDDNGALEKQEDVFTNGTTAIKYLDTRNTHPYAELDIDEDATGKPIDVQMKLDGQPNNTTADFSSVGQVLGSALGRALAPNNQFVQLVAGTVVGAVGQKLAQAFAASLTTNGAAFDLSRTFADFNISIASAGASSIASFLVAELGTALHLDGFGGQLFNASAGGFAGSVASQVASKMAQGASFDLAIGTINFADAAASAAYGVSALFGSFLAHEFVPAQTHEGAVAGQLFGAIGSAAGISAALSGALGTVLGFIAPGIGSLIGTILGTLIGDAFGSVPHPAATDLLDQAGTLYAATHYQVSASDGGDYSTPDQMAVPALAIINAYLSAVNGAALDHSKQVTLGYQANPEFYIDGVPGHPAIGTYLSPNAAVQAAALDVLQNTEVVGGDLLMKRAHQNSSSNHPLAVPSPDPTSQNGDPGPTGTAVVVSAAEQLAIMSGDLGVAQDYENYLNNREAINALMAANPDSAFTAGWIATFARVNELGLNHVNASDFLGGLVGYLDSVSKAGLGAGAANASVKQGGGGSIDVEVHVGNGVEVPGSLAAFADQTSVTSDATGQTVQFVFASNIAAGGFHLLGAGATGGDTGNDLWFGGGSVANVFHAASGSGSDILVGGSTTDVIHAGSGWDFIDGGAGTDFLFGEDGNDILRGGAGGDFLFGGSGDDTYVFARGDGADTVLDESTQQVGADGGNDTLAFDPGIARSDIVVWQSGNDLIVGVRDPAHPNVPFTQLTDRITLQHWFDLNGTDRIEFLRFADGTTLNLAAGQSALASYEFPAGATLSNNTVAENSAIGTAVGTVTGFDLDANASLTYSLISDVTGGRFAINTSTGAITVAGALNYEATSAWPVTVRVADQVGHVFDKPFVINVTDVNERPVGSTLSGGSVAENSANGTVVGTATGIDPDAGTAFTYSLTDDAGGRFAINPSTGVVTVANGALLDYEAATSWQIGVRTADQYGLYFDKPFPIAVTDVYEGPFGFEPATFRLSGFTIGAGGWSDQNHYPRQVADVNGDGMADIVGFGGAGVHVSLATGNGNFASPAFELAAFAINAGGWSSQDAYPRLLGDVNGDGMADIVGFGGAGVYVSLATGNGHFASPIGETATFGLVAGWTSQNQDPRLLADVNGDGKADIVGFSGDMAVVSLATGNGQFAAPLAGIQNFTPSAGGWAGQNLYPRDLGDVNGDGVADIVGFGQDGVFDALSNGFYHINHAPVLVNNSDGTSTLTITDDPDNHAWTSFASNFSQPYGQGSLLSQTGVNDGGSKWQNIFDTSNAYSWDHYTAAYTPTGQLITQTGTNDNGTHWLTANDPSNAYNWSTFTMTFDIDWNVTSIINVTNDDGTHTPDAGQIWASFDTLTWYPNPYVVSLDRVVNPASDGLPVILDLDGNGIDITPLNVSSAAFDMDGRPGREHTAWSGGKDGFLAIDLGADGKPGPDGVIDQAKEIVFTQWSPGATSDMAALRDVFDTNHNGSLDQGDARWGEFRIWQDANADGVSQAGEVKTLDALGISTIGLNPTGPSKSFSDGSAIQGLSSFTRTDGTTGAAADVSLAYQHRAADTPGITGPAFGDVLWRHDNATSANPESEPIGPYSLPAVLNDWHIV
jgi:hypothetical protein